MKNKLSTNNDLSLKSKNLFYFSNNLPIKIGRILKFGILLAFSHLKSSKKSTFQIIQNDKENNKRNLLGNYWRRGRMRS